MVNGKNRQGRKLKHLVNGKTNKRPNGENGKMVKLLNW